MKRDDLARLFVHGDPDPVWGGLLLHKTPQLVCLHVQTSDKHSMGGRNGLHMEMLRHRRKAGNYEVHEPPDTDTNGTANAVQGDLLAEQALHQDALFFNDHPVRVYHTIKFTSY